MYFAKSLPNRFNCCSTYSMTIGTKVFFPIQWRCNCISCWFFFNVSQFPSEYFFIGLLAIYWPRLSMYLVIFTLFIIYRHISLVYQIVLCWLIFKSYLCVLFTNLLLYTCIKNIFFLFCGMYVSSIYRVCYNTFKFWYN